MRDRRGPRRCHYLRAFQGRGPRTPRSPSTTPGGHGRLGDFNLAPIQHSTASRSTLLLTRDCQSGLAGASAPAGHSEPPTAPSSSRSLGIRHQEGDVFDADDGGVDRPEAAAATSGKLNMATAGKPSRRARRPTAAARAARPACCAFPRWAQGAFRASASAHRPPHARLPAVRPELCEPEGRAPWPRPAPTPTRGSRRYFAS